MDTGSIKSNRYMRWFYPPVYEDPVKQIKAILLDKVINILILGTVIWIPLRIGLGTNNNPIGLTVVIAIVSILLQKFLNHNHHTASASFINILTLFSILSYFLYYSGGLNSSNYIGFFVVILLTLLLFNKTIAIIVTMSIVGIGYTILRLQSNNELPESITTPSLINTFGTQTFILILSLTILVLYHDIRASVETYLRESEEKRAAIIDETLDAVIMINNFGLIDDVNNSCLSLFGYVQDELVGENISMLMPEPHQTEHDQYLKNYHETQVPHIIGTGRELEGLKKDGTIFPIYLTVSKLEIQGGVFFSWIIRDITNQKLVENSLIKSKEELEEAIMERTQELSKLAEKLNQSNEDLEQFAYTVSHDLNEPLRMVNTYLQLLHKKNKDLLDEKSTKYIDFAVDGTSRMKILINDLLEISRVGTNNLQVVLVDLNDVIEEIKQSLKILILENDVTIIHPLLPSIKADRSLMTQLFQNLIQNAIKYRSEKQPNIIISSALQNGDFHFEVKDNGVGIDPDNLERIFVVFQQLEKESSGSGIGLAIVKKIVTKHGGKIWVESRIGYGSTFHFTISNSIK